MASMIDLISTYLGEVDSLWIYITLGVFFLCEVVLCLYPWEKDSKIEKTKAKDGTEVIIVSKLRK